MPIIQPYIPTAHEFHLDQLWVRAECFRFCVQERRRNCTFLQTMDLWLQAPVCSDCAASDPFLSRSLPDVVPRDWEVGLLLSLGKDLLDHVREQLATDSDFAFECKKCHSLIAPWKTDDLYVSTYHLEEHYGLSLELPGQIEPPRAVRRLVTRLYDNACFGCGIKGCRLHIDHVMPRSAGGTAAFRNLQPLCEHCGNRKADARPEEVAVYDDLYFYSAPSDGYEGLFW